MNELLKRGYEGVGSDIQPEYSGVDDGSPVTKADYVQLDITDKAAVEKIITEIKPDAVIHCAAWTAVDAAEDEENIDKVRAINAGGTRNIAEVCKSLDCKMTYTSTDYVFDGQEIYHGSRTVRTMLLSMCMDRQSLRVSLRYLNCLINTS